MNKRPDHLPDFEEPPLVEVAVGLQFNAPPGYTSLYAGDVFKLFKDRFPKPVEQFPMPPSFELFGNSHPQAFQFNLQPQIGVNRYWFLSNDESELIQFQNDRFVRNWRKKGVSPYPRFETIAENFFEDIRKVEDLFQQSGLGRILVNQCELNYINVIPLISSGENLELTEIIGGFNGLSNGFSDFSATLKKVIKNEREIPIGRVTVELTTGNDEHRQPSLFMQITARGAPPSSDLDGAKIFLNAARQNIVETFSALTTAKAHKIWRRKQ